MSDCKRVYRFGTDAQGTCVTEGDKSMNFVLGGKGANLAEMSRIGLPVPGGFTITCQTCVEYSGAGNVWPEGALDEIVAAEADLEARCLKKLGDANDPLLVSVRSGAPFSMPGMMDTVLNLGLNDDSVQGLIAQTQNPRFAWDSYRRFIQMFSNVVMGVDADLFEIVRGALPDVPTKPAPEGTRALMASLGVTPDGSVLYVGDSNVDADTAHNAGLPCCGVLWGFRTREELTAAGAEYLAEDAAALEKVILG